MKPTRTNRQCCFDGNDTKMKEFPVEVACASGERSQLSIPSSHNSVPMNSTVTIDDTDEEVIDLDVSQDDVIEETYNNLGEKQQSVQKEFDTNVVEVIADVPASDNSNKPEPLLKVMFRDERVSRKYRRRIKDFLEKLVSTKEKCQETEGTFDLTLAIWDSDADCVTNNSVDIVESDDNQTDMVCDTLFMVDKQPRLKNDIDVPTYGKKYDETAFEKPNKEESAESKEENYPKIMCFNCKENHSLRDCTKPRNYNNINKNRKNFNMKGNSKSVRYHLDSDQKFDHIVPGQLTSNLRKALGLKDNDLPKHIYRMRTLGYPPGWLEEARLQHSGISLFNSDGTIESDPNDELGEIHDEGYKDQYDTTKIFDFPGFNVSPPLGTRDDEGQHWERHMQAHSKERMLSMLGNKKAAEGYKRKKLKLSNNTSVDNKVSEPCEMEIEVEEEITEESVSVNGLFVPPLPQDSSGKSLDKPPLPSLQSAVSEDSDYQSQELPSSIESPSNSTPPSSRTNSPSLSDLENMKKRLLVELQDSSPQLNSDSLSKAGSLNSSFKMEMPPPSNEGTPEPNHSRGLRSSLNTSHGSVKSVDLGTPLLQSTSPYSKLPPSEKFSKNICDVINFENLPDSTGKYEQMNGVLQKVRNALAKLNQE